MGADIRKTVNLLLRVPLKEERLSQEREWGSGTRFVGKFAEGCRTTRRAMMRDEDPCLVEYRLHFELEKVGVCEG
jgi:hypothetical protein